MKERGRQWTKEETEIALRMKREGRSPAEIAETLHRTRASVINRIDYVTMPDFRRSQVRDRVNAYRRDMRGSDVLDTKIVAHRPPHESIVERDRLLGIPRPLTAELMGDPLPGRSALDRRQQR